MNKTIRFTELARDWNTKDEFSGYVGYVMEFEIKDDFISNYDVHIVGGNIHQEYWIPANELEEFNDNIIGYIKVIDKYSGK